MGHFCRLCGRARPNERFSRHGRRIHVCRDCQGMPAPERERIEQEAEVFGYLKQSHISDKNLRRLRTLVASGQPEIAELAAIVLDVASVKPYKKRRLKVLAQQRPDLLDALDRTGLIMAHHC